MYQIKILIRAIRCFNMAIKSNPTYIRAYMCRAQAFKKIHNVSSSAYKALRN